MSDTKQGGFFYCPAAMNTNIFGGLGLYVRYHKTNRNDIELAWETPAGALFKTPDRDLLFVNDLHMTSSTRPIDENWDELIALAPSSIGFNDFELDYGMVNHTFHFKKPSMHLKRDPKIGLSRTKWISDSGGFQVISGKIGYLDPVKTAEWYNEYVDIGIGIDIPLPNPSMQGQAMSDQVAHILKRNNTAMLGVLNDTTKLMNVIHGWNADSFMRYHDIVFDARSKHLCISDIYRSTALDAVSTLIEVVGRLPKDHYEHIHVLGIYNTRITVLLARAMRLFFPKIVFTCDSSSYMKAANGWQMALQRNIDRPLERMEIGANASKAINPTVNRHLPCSCGICSRVKYTDIFSYTRRVPNYFLLYHNLFEMVRFCKNVSTAAEELDNAQYRELVKGYLAGNNHIKDSLVGLDFIEACQKEGHKKAKKKFEYYLQQDTQGGLFKQTTLIDHGEQVEVVNEAELLSHVTDALAAYSVEAVKTKKTKHGRTNTSKEVRTIMGAHEKKRGHHVVNIARKKAGGLKAVKKTKEKVKK